MQDIQFLPFDKMIEIVYTYIIGNNLSMLPIFKNHNSSSNRSSISLSDQDMYDADDMPPCNLNMLGKNNVFQNSEKKLMVH